MKVAGTVLILTLALMLACQAPRKDTGIPSEQFGEYNGEPVMLYTLKSETGEVKVMNYGAAIQSIRVPDEDGNLGEVTLGFDTFAEYPEKSPFFGSVVGRYGNRIEGGAFEIDGEKFTLPTNNGENSLHGGNEGFDKRMWTAEPAMTDSGPSVRFSLVSPDDDQGYPGTLTASVIYTWTNDNELILDYRAITDEPTVVNLTNHTYFNLKDGGASPVLDHIVMIRADGYLPVNQALIPYGSVAPVTGSPFDFNKPISIGARIDMEHEQLEFGGGYDHNFVLTNQDGDLALAATVIEPTTNRVMEVFTTEPGMQFYSGNFLSELEGRNGIVYEKRHGFCMETQHYPNSPNEPDFPSTKLEPQEIYETTTIYKFSVN